MSEPLPEAGKRARSGCRVAIRTAKPLSYKWRTMGRPRNPVPPNTVTTCPGTGRTYAVAGTRRDRIQAAWPVRRMRAPAAMRLRSGFRYPAIRAYERLTESRTNPRVYSWVSPDWLQTTHCKYSKKLDILAEREGFEPSVPRKEDNGFRDRPVRPLRHLSVLMWRAVAAAAIPGGRRH